MGLAPDYITKVCNHFPSHSTEQLVNYLLENPFDNGTIPDVIQEEKPAEEEAEDLEVDVMKTANMANSEGESSEYELVSTVVHLGKSVGSGHYVAYVKEQLREGGRKWLYYNDDAVYHSGKPRLDKSYVLFLRKVSAEKIVEE